MAFTPRLTAAGILNNPMWYSDNPYWQRGYGMPNCTCYCYGRVYEILGSKPIWIPQANAGDWYKTWPYEIDMIPRLGSIYCVTDPNGYYEGHVGIVEDIMPNSDILCSNSASQGDFFLITQEKKSEGYIAPWAQEAGMRLAGFLHLPGAPIATEWIKGNRYLNQAEMDNNATIVYSRLYNSGWSLNAICGLLGNFWKESTINPGVWENLDDTNPSGGYGLAQWTPSTKWTNYATAQGWAIDDGDKQLEFCNNDPISNYIPTTAYPETLAAFKVSEETPEYLASAWLYNYERAGVAAEEERRRWARYYYDLFEGTTPTPPTPGRILGLKIWQMIKYKY